jgi:hypothetical protein
MKTANSGKEQKALVSFARTALIAGWILCSLSIVLAGAIWYGRSTMVQHWQPSQVGPFKQDCLAALSHEPHMAARFQTFCKHFEIATSTCLGMTAWAIFFLSIMAVLSACHARFGYRVLKHMKETEIHNHTPDGSRQPADGSPKPST